LNDVEATPDELVTADPLWVPSANVTVLPLTG
jgi:hypothetical protein